MCEKCNLFDSRRCNVTSMEQLLLTLRFYANGSFGICAAEFAGVSVTTAYETVKRVSVAIGGLFTDYVKMPSNRDEIRQAQYSFFSVARLPMVIGAIDCTHIKIQSPGLRSIIY